MKRTFNKCFYDSDNRRGFFSVLADVDGVKLTRLLGEYTDADLRNYDRIIKASVGDNYISPILETVFIENNPLADRQDECARIFYLLKYENLLKIKNAMETEIDSTGGNTRKTERETESEDTREVSAFNSDDMQDDTKSGFTGTVTETVKDSEGRARTVIANINGLSDFWRKSFIDRIIDAIKDLFLLNVLD